MSVLTTAYGVPSGVIVPVVRENPKNSQGRSAGQPIAARSSSLFVSGPSAFSRPWPLVDQLRNAPSIKSTGTHEPLSVPTPRPAMQPEMVMKLFSALVSKSRLPKPEPPEPDAVPETV